MKLKFKNAFVDRHEKYFIACSGGIDSVAISHYLTTCYLKIKPTLLHINNKLFEIDDIAEQNVLRLASKLQCECKTVTKRVCVNAKNLESKCRDTRINAYIWDTFGYNVILCHHLDDAVESYLMNCFNGTNSYLPIPETTMLKDRQRIIRPFLTTTTKKDLETYCIVNNLIQYVINDPLNAKSNRGWLRREIIPRVNKRYPGLYKVVRKKYL